MTALTCAETRDSLRRFNISAGYRSVFDTVGGGSTFIFVGFACSLGLAKEQLGWLTFLVSSACLIQMAGIPLLRRARNKKRFALNLALGEPLVLIAAVLLAMFLPAPWRLYAFAAAVFVGAAFLQLSRPLTDDWLASTVPAEIRGRYLGRRTQLLSVVIIASTLAAGWLGERVGMANTRGLGLLIIGGALCAITSVLVLRDAAMPALAATSQPHWSDLHAIVPTLQSALYDSVPAAPARPSYFAVSNILTLVFYAAGGALAVPLLERLKSAQLHVGPFILGNFHVLYGLCAALTLVTLFAARLAPARAAKPGTPAWG